MQEEHGRCLGYRKMAMELSKKLGIAVNQKGFKESLDTGSHRKEILLILSANTLRGGYNISSSP